MPWGEISREYRGVRAPYLCHRGVLIGNQVLSRVLLLLILLKKSFLLVCYTFLSFPSPSPKAFITDSNNQKLDKNELWWETFGGKNWIVCIVKTHLRAAPEPALNPQTLHGAGESEQGLFPHTGNLLQMCLPASDKNKGGKQFEGTSTKISLNCMWHFSRLSQISFHVGKKNPSEILIMSKWKTQCYHVLDHQWHSKMLFEIPSKVSFSSSLSKVCFTISWQQSEYENCMCFSKLCAIGIPNTLWG